MGVVQAGTKISLVKGLFLACVCVSCCGGQLPNLSLAPSSPPPLLAPTTTVEAPWEGRRKCFQAPPPKQRLRATHLLALWAPSPGVPALARSLGHNSGGGEVSAPPPDIEQPLNEVSLFAHVA